MEALISLNSIGVRFSTSGTLFSSLNLINCFVSLSTFIMLIIEKYLKIYIKKKLDNTKNIRLLTFCKLQPI